MANKLELSGSEQFSASPEQVFAALVDLDRLAANIPDVESADRIDADTLKCVVRPGFSFVRGKVNLVIQVVERQTASLAKMQTTMQGIGQQMKAESIVQLEPIASGTLLRWQVNVLELKGLLSAVSPSLIKGAAENIIRGVWQRMRSEFEPPSAAAT